MATEIRNVKQDDKKLYSLVNGRIVDQVTWISIEFSAGVSSLVEAYLMSEDVLTKTKKYVTPMQVCAMMTKIDEPCLCSQIRLALMYAVQEHGMLTSFHGNRFSLA